MESQFRCGKCGKPIASKFSKCPDCGSLGPHNFNAQETAPVEEGGSPRPPRRKDSYPAERFAPEQPLSSQRERHAAPGPVELPTEPPQRAMHDSDNDSRFPAGMRSRSPILRDIEAMDKYEEGRTSRSGRDSDRDSNEAPEERNGYGSYGDEEEEPAQKRSNSKVTMIVTITLVLILIVAAIYIVGNFDDLTRWLASPTIPETVRPSN